MGRPASLEVSQFSLKLFYSVNIHLLTPGNEGFDPALKDAALKENTALAFEALNPDVSSQPDHFPLIAAAGVLLLEADHITQFYLHNHYSYLKELG